MSSKSLAKKPEAPDWTPEQMKLIVDTVARGATQDELKLFLYRCKHMGLDPLKPGQIYFVKYGNSPGTIVVGIEGFRARAGKTGKLSGIKRGALKDAKGVLVGAWAEVYRHDWKEPAREEVPLSEYTTGKAGWAKMPETMIKKVAEAAALRMAFPDDLGGIYEAAEMEQAQAKNEPPRIYSDQPEPEDGTPPEEPFEFRFRVGKFAKRGLPDTEENFGLDAMRTWVEKVEARHEVAKKKGVPIENEVLWLEDVAACSRYIAHRENASSESTGPRWDEEEIGEGIG